VIEMEGEGIDRISMMQSLKLNGVLELLDHCLPSNVEDLAGIETVGAIEVEIEVEIVAGIEADVMIMTGRVVGQLSLVMMRDRLCVAMITIGPEKTPQHSPTLHEDVMMDLLDEMTLEETTEIVLQDDVKLHLTGTGLVKTRRRSRKRSLDVVMVTVAPDGMMVIASRDVILIIEEMITGTGVERILLMELKPSAKR
jgi:hypothetical protein